MAIAWLTFSRVEFATFSGVWIARETVAIETCAIRATSSIVVGLDVDKLALTGHGKSGGREAGHPELH